MTTICRFAPSPTGLLHVGNIRAAIINFLYAKKTGGRFILRLDDTDIERVKEEYRLGILEDMAWLGLEYDELFKQSDRLEKYELAKNKLIASGRLYECFESQTDLSLQRKSQIASGIPPIYDRSSLNLTSEQKENYKKQGILPYYRFLLEDQIVSWEDKIKGKITYAGRSFSDPVLFRENGVPTYTFCSVVDDIEMGITDIIRGEDHITNTAIQYQIFKSLGAEVPNFSHLALIKASMGKISKRIGGFDIKSLRESGFESLSIINLLSQVGSSGNINIYGDINHLISGFDLNKFSKSPTKYDLEELEIINQKLLQILPFQVVQKKFSELGLDKKIDENFWNAIKQNIGFLLEIKDWWKIIKEPFLYEHKQEDREFLKIANEALPEDTSQIESWQIWISNIKEKSDRKGKNLFMPLRLALTGRQNGPELKNILPLIDRQEIINRVLV